MPGKPQVPTLVATWMDLGIIILSQTEKDKYYMISDDIAYMWNLKKTDTNELTKETHRHTKQTYSSQTGKGRRDKLGVWD